MESFLSPDPDSRIRAFQRAAGTTQVGGVLSLPLHKKRMLGYVAAAIVAVMLLVFA